MRGAAVDARTNLGKTALILASQAGHALVVRALLGAGADANAHTGGSGWTSLHAASQHGRLEVVRELIKGNAHLDALTELRRTPLMSACSNGHLMCAAALIGFGADIRLLDHEGISARGKAERRLEVDDEEPEEGSKPTTTLLRAQHRRLVRALKGMGAR